MYRILSAQNYHEPLIAELLKIAPHFEFISPCVDDCTACIAVIENGQAVGFTRLRRWFRGGEISDVFVHPTFRRLGIATAMISWLLQEACELNYLYVELTCSQDNIAAVAVYKRLGFKTTRVIDGDHESHGLFVMRMESFVFKHFCRDYWRRKHEDAAS